ARDKLGPGRRDLLLRWGRIALGSNLRRFSRPIQHNLWTAASLSSSLGVKTLSDRLYLVPQPLVFLKLVSDLLAGVKCGRVLSSSAGLAGGGRRSWSVFADEEHRCLSRKDDVLVPPLALHVVARGG